MIRRAAVPSGINMLRGCRTLATAATAYTSGRVSGLSNGLTVVSEKNPQAKSATVGLYYRGGSRSEHESSNGVSALATDILATTKAPKAGVLLSSLNKKESNGIIAQTSNENVTVSADVLGEIVNNWQQVLAENNFTASKARLSAKATARELTPQSKVLLHLEATAYQGFPLGLPAEGTTDSIANLEQQDVVRFLEHHLVGSNVVVAASGNFEHEELVDAIEKTVRVPNGAKPPVTPQAFLGSEVRMRDDTLPKAYIALAVEAGGFSSPNPYLSLVASHIVGTYDRDSIQSKLSSPKLASIVQEYDIVDKYNHFDTKFSDTGLWGFASEISNVGAVDEFVHFTLKQWNRLSVSVTEAEVVRAKAAFKTSLLRALNTPQKAVDILADQVLLQGHRTSLTEALQHVDAISSKDIKNWAQGTLWDQDIVISGTGQIEDLLDYNRWRNGMAMMRF